MNWLMYIGGGYLWINLWLYLIKNHTIKTNVEAIVYLWYLVSTILAWWWICWRFIA